MAENFDVIVPLKEDQKKLSIFGLSSKPALGLIQRFAGKPHEVLPVMQKLSNDTRTFTWNENGFSRTIFMPDIM